MKTWLVDFEFCSKPGERPRPWCVVGRCVETGELVREWLDGRNIACPFPSPYRLAAHYAMAELGCYDVLGWPMPDAVVDTLPECRAVCGQKQIGGWGLLSCCRWAGVPTVATEYKDEMRGVAMANEVPEGKRADLLDYCQSDVDALAGLWAFLSPHINMPLADLRGRYLKALAAVESRGIPVDSGLVCLLRDRWGDVKDAARAAAINAYPGVIRPDGSFSSAAWVDWCETRDIHWPTLASGTPALDEDVFKKMADRHPEVRVMAYTRRLLGQARAFEWPLGHDDRLRCMLSPFGSDTGRNQPGNSRYIFGAPAWMRKVIQAPSGRVLAYVDYSSQEFALAAALSGDGAMADDYQLGDPYIGLARRAGSVPLDATKATHPNERAAFKVTALAVQYGMQAPSLASQLGISLSSAAHLIDCHRRAYPQFWRWRQNVIDHVMTGGDISTRFGWRRVHRGLLDRATSIANFPIQAGGAETLRLAVIALEEAGHRVVAPVHDAVMVELSENGADESLAEVRRLMELAGEAVTGGLKIRTDVEMVKPGDHFVDKRGVEMWELLEGKI
jgi:DNA polymerase-1